MKYLFIIMVILSLSGCSGCSTAYDIIYTDCDQQKYAEWVVKCLESRKNSEFPNLRQCEESGEKIFCKPRMIKDLNKKLSGDK